MTFKVLMFLTPIYTTMRNNNNNKGQGGADADLPMIESNLQGGSVYTLNRSGIEMNLKYNF